MKSFFTLVAFVLCLQSFAIDTPVTNNDKVFIHNKETGEIKFRDTNNELLQEIYFYNAKNEVIASVKNITATTNFEIGCWNEVHHITIITDKDIHVEFVK